LIGQIAETSKMITPKRSGKVFVRGEIWNAISSETIKKGEEVTVIEIKGLTLKVETLKKEV